MNFLDLKKKYSSKHLPLRIIAAGFVLTITFFLLFLENTKLYNSTVSILVIPKSQLAVSQKEAIISNMEYVAGTLNFYDRLLAENPSIKDVTQTASPDERKANWNKFLSIETRDTEGGTVMELSVKAENRIDSELLSQKTSQTLFGVMANYYDIKHDLDLRIIEGPNSSAVMAGWFWFFIISAILGFGLAFLLDKSIQLLFSSFAKKPKIDLGNLFSVRKEKKIKGLEDLYSQEEKAALYSESEIEKPSQHLEREENEKVKPKEELFEMPEYTYPNFPEMPKAHRVTAEAPANLPIQDEDAYAFQAAPEEKSKKEELETEQITEEDENREPTPEELKRRLNQLLKGD